MVMASANRRIGVRVPVKFKVDYIHKGNYIISYNKDISVDGMFICTKNPPAVGSHLKLIFSLGESKGVEVAAIVVWVNNRSAKTSGMGVQFLTPPSPRLKQNIVQVVNRVVVLEKRAQVVS